jgi:hypothetical protein
VTLISKFSGIGKKHPYVGHYNPNYKLLLSNSSLYDTYISEFRNTTYGPKNLFTIGELSQAKASEGSALNVDQSQFYSTAYLPIDTL